MWGRQTFLLYLGCTLGVLCLLAHAQTQAQGIAVLKSHDIEPFNQAIAGFVTACNGQITEYDIRGSKGKQRSIIERIVAARPKLILAIGAMAAQVAKEAVRDIPVVFFMVPNPHKYGLEGKNIAGISLDIPIETQFTMYKSLVPRLKTIGVIYDPEKTGALVTEARGSSATIRAPTPGVRRQVAKRRPCSTAQYAGADRCAVDGPGRYRGDLRVVPIFIAHGV